MVIISGCRLYYTLQKMGLPRSSLGSLKIRPLSKPLIYTPVTGNFLKTFNAFNTFNAYGFRYAYTLQYFTPKVTRSSWPAQTQKLMDYNKANNLNMFEAEKGFVIASQVFMTTGVKVKRCYSNIPFSPEVWAALSDPVNLQLLEEKIKDWNLQTDAKLKETSPGAKLDLEETIGHIPTLDDRVQVFSIVCIFIYIFI